MKPLPKIEELQVKELSVFEHRELIVELAKQQNGCIFRLKDGITLRVTRQSDDDVDIEKIEPWYEFDDENEIRKYLTTDNEEFENFVRWQKLKNILDEE